MRDKIKKNKQEESLIFVGRPSFCALNFLLCAYVTTKTKPNKTLKSLGGKLHQLFFSTCHGLLHFEGSPPPKNAASSKQTTRGSCVPHPTYPGALCDLQDQVQTSMGSAEARAPCPLTTMSNSHLYVVNKKQFTFQQRHQVSPTHQRGQQGSPRSPPRKIAKK